MDAVGQETWTNVFHAHRGRFITEEVLKETHEKLNRAYQEEGEDEDAFGVRIMKTYHRCRHVFTSIELVNMYIRGLMPEIRDTVIQQLHLFPLEQMGNMSAARYV